MFFILTTIFFIFGLIIGSFLNVVILRFNTQSLGGHSGCTSCNRQLTWHELIPLLSFFVLGRRCLNCKNKISIQYPLVEFFTGIIFLSLFLKFQDIFFNNQSIFFITYIYYAILFSILIVISVYDLKHKVIPDKLSLIFGIITFVGLFFFHNTVALSRDFIFQPHFPNYLEILSGLVISLPFGLFWLLSGGRLMGLGDAKLAIGLGWFLGWPLILSGTVFAFWSGAIIGILGILISKIASRGIMGIKYTMKSEIPFAPFLVLGATLTFFLEFNFFSFFYF
jgi:leader peptidase (prepilin peptidase)/N-methyltransferase